MEKKRRLGFQLLDLPVHLLQQIMIHLPPSSVPPCAAVCTVFRNIAADPSFRQLYFSQTPISCVLLSNNHRLSILPSHSPLPPSSSPSSCFAVANSSPSVGHTIPDHTKTLSSITLNKSMNLVNSSHGLVCLRSNIRYHVCNPLSGEFLTLPPPPTPLDGDDEEYFSVFGFDPQRNHYKILQIVPEKMVAELYQIGDDTWRAIYFPPSALLKLNSVFDPSLNGALHWITTSTRLEELICSFDLNREEFRWVPPPSCLQLQGSESVGVFKGKLCLCCVRGAQAKAQFETWLMEEGVGGRPSASTLILIAGFSPKTSTGPLGLAAMVTCGSQMMKTTLIPISLSGVWYLTYLKSVTSDKLKLGAFLQPKWKPLLMF